MYKIAIIKLIFVVLVYKNSTGQQNAESILTFDELKKGIAVEKSPSSYLASDDAVYSIGDFITIGTPVSKKTFGYLG